MGVQIFHRGEPDKVGKEGHRRKHMVQHQDILWRTLPRLHTVITLNVRQESQIRPRQKHKIRIHRYRKGRKLHNGHVRHDETATPRKYKTNERKQKIGARNGTSVNKTNGGADDNNVQ